MSRMGGAVEASGGTGGGNKGMELYNHASPGIFVNIFFFCPSVMIIPLFAFRADQVANK